MTFKPKPWIAAILGLLSALGMLYVQRPGLWLAYFAAALAAAVAPFAAALMGYGISPGLMTFAACAVAIACAAHAYRIAAGSESTPARAWYSHWYGIVGVWIMVFMAVFALRAFVYEPFRVPSGSMHPTIPEGSYVLVSKHGYGHYGTFGVVPFRGAVTETVARGDIMVHELPSDPQTIYLKRVIGLPGDQIEYVDRRLSINGQAVPIAIDRTENGFIYATETIDGHPVTVELIPGRPPKNYSVKVPPGHYVMFGDSRDNAHDSRYIGMIRQEHLVGKVIRIFPP